MIINPENTIKRVSVIHSEGMWKNFHYTTDTALDTVRKAVDSIGGAKWAGKPFDVHSCGKRKGQVYEYRGAQEGHKEVEVIQKDGSIKTLYVWGKYCASYDKVELEEYKAMEIARQEKESALRKQRKAITEAMTQLTEEQLTQLAQYIDTLTNR